MFSRVVVSAVSLAVSILVFVSCGDGQPVPARTSVSSPTPTAASVPAPTATPTPALVPTPSISSPTPTAASVAASISPPTLGLSYLTEKIPPCTPVPGSSVDPCDPDAPPFEMGMAQSVPELGDEPLSMREMLDDDPPPAWVTHLALRGTYLPGTVRCTAGDPFSPPSYLQDEFVYTANTLSVKCYIDVRTNSYVLGSGPTTLTILLFRGIYWDGNYAPFTPYVYEDQSEQELIEEDMQRIEGFISDLFVGREHILFLGPPVDLSSEVWRFLGYWDVQQREDGTVIAVHPDRDLWRRLRPNEYQTHLSALEMELSAFTQAVTTANQARVTEYAGRIGADTSLPMLVNDANQLRQYYTEVGAYAPGAPTPVQPPPPCGLAVPDQGNNPGLMRDCVALLMARDELRGTATLNWGGDTPITDWTGIKVTGSPSRVTVLDLSMRGLDGSIPPGLGSLTGLDILSLDNNRLSGAIPPELGSLANLRFLYLYKNRLTGGIPAELGSLASLNTMWLFNNQLTGSIPAELEDLSNLERLGLDNNQLTGCIPPELRDVPENDLGRLGLQDCVVPGSVSTPTVTVGDERLDVSWTAPSDDGGSPITRYKIRYKRSADSSWTDGGTATTTDTPISGLANGTPYEVQVRACSVGGCGPWSASGTGTPRAPLTLPTVEDQSAKEGQAFSQALSEATGGISPYTYTVTGLRAGLTFEASTLTVSGTPTASGDQSVTYTVTDSASGSAEQTFTIAVAAPSCSDTGLSSDCAVLLAAKDTLRGTATLNWSTNTAITSWDGVTLGGTPRRVTGLDLHGRSLTGSIPSGLGGLTHLQILRLYDNQLTGSLPSQLGSLTNLRILSMSDNRLTGSIPTQLGSLTNLQTLLLANNRLTGSIPTQLGRLTNLRSLWLRGNQLTGRIPTQLGSLTELRTLLLDFNRLSGSIPTELTNLNNLVTLWISDNRLSGCIPPALRNVRFHDLDLLGLSDCASGTSGQPPSDSGGQSDSLSPPEFGQDAYSFTVSEDAATGAFVGSAVAEGPDGAPVAYRITGGNEAGRFSVGASGEIAVVGSLDYETASSYTLTVAATEAYGGATATVPVEIAVTDATEPSS